MARPLRIEYEGACYHVMARANEGKRIFRSKGDFERFQWYLREAKERFGCVYHCYVVMGTHYHVLVETPEGNLNRVVQYVNGSYAAYWNVKSGRGGPVFRGRYKAILVERDAYFLELSRCLHLNPVRAQMVERPEEYERFSPHRFASNFKTPHLVIHGALDFRISETEAMQLFTALQRRGIQSKYLYFPDEGHWVLKPCNSEYWHQTVFAWLAEYLKP